MSHVRLLICRVDEGDNQVTERARVTLPPVLADAGAAPLDTLEAQVATVGQCLLGRLCELQWDAIDAQAVARYRAGQAPGSVVADGSDTLFVASRFGTLQLRRQVCAHHDGRPHIMPGKYHPAKAGPVSVPWPREGAGRVGEAAVVTTVPL